MSEIKFNAADVKHVLKNSKDDKVIITADGHIFELKSKNYAIDHCNKKELKWAFANENGIIVEDVEQKAPETKIIPYAEMLEKAKINLEKAQEFADAKQKAFDEIPVDEKGDAKDAKAKKTASSNLEKALLKLDEAKTKFAACEALTDDSTDDSAK